MTNKQSGHAFLQISVTAGHFLGNKPRLTQTLAILLDWLKIVDIYLVIAVMHQNGVGLITTN